MAATERAPERTEANPYHIIIGNRVSMELENIREFSFLPLIC